jgi:hypothetical protein
MRDIQRELLPAGDPCAGEPTQSPVVEASTSSPAITGGVLGELSEFLTRRKQRRGGTFLPLVRVERWED